MTGQFVPRFIAMFNKLVSACIINLDYREMPISLPDTATSADMSKCVRERFVRLWPSLRPFDRRQLTANPR